MAWGWKHDIYNSSRYVCSDDVVCLGLREGSFFFDTICDSQSPRPSHHIQFQSFKAWDIYCFNFTSRCFFSSILIPAIVTCHLTFDTRFWNGVGGRMVICHVSWSGIMLEQSTPLLNILELNKFFAFPGMLFFAYCHVTPLPSQPRRNRNFVTRKSKNAFPQQLLWSINSCYSAIWQ